MKKPFTLSRNVARPAAHCLVDAATPRTRPSSSFAVLLALGLLSSLHPDLASAATCTLTSPTTWNLGTSGNWNTASNWNPAAVPNGSGTNVCITDGSSIVTLNTSPSVGSLQLASGNTLNFAAGYAFTIAGPTIDNAGVIQINASGSVPQVYVGDTTLSGGGKVTLSESGGGTAYLRGNGNGHTLTNVDNLIQGAGIIGDQYTLAFVNQAAGVVNANASGQTLSLNQAGGGVTNTGTLKASNGGTLALWSTINNNGGSITADGGTVSLQNATVTKGTLNTLNSGTLQTAYGYTTTLDGVTLSSGSTYTGQPGSNTYLSNTITNNGTMQIGGGIYNSLLFANTPTTTLTGGGTVMLNVGSANTFLRATTNGNTLVNLDNTIQGAGVIGDSTVLHFTNNATVNANATGQTLSLNQAGGGVINTGLLTATSGGTLALYNSIINTGANITANGGAVNLQNAAITGGTLNTLNGGTLQTAYGYTTTLDNVTLSSGSTYTGQPGSVTNLNNTITNNGTIQIGGGIYNSFLNANTLTTTLTGGGTVTLNVGSANTFLRATTNGNTLVNLDNTIQGAGVIGDSTVLHFTNNATVNANSSGQTLNLNAANGGVINNGLLEATNGGTLVLNYGISNTNHNITADNGTVTLSNATITGGTLTTTNGGTLQTANQATLDGVTLSTGSLYTGLQGTSTYLNNTITNNGTIQIGGGIYTSFLYANTPTTTLTGGGTVTLNVGSANTFLRASVNGNTLVNADNLIQGAGYIGDSAVLHFTNQAAGTVSANSVGQTLSLNQAGGGVINTGLLTATNGGTLALYNGINNTGANITADNGAVTLSNATITGGTLNTINGGTLQTANQATLDGVTLSTGSLYTGLQGTSTYLNNTITNNGTIQIGGGIYTSFLYANTPTTTLTGGGTVTLNVGSANTYLRATTNGNALVNVDNLIQGAGNIGDSGLLPFTNQAAGTVSANVSGKVLSVGGGGGSITNNGLFRALADSTLNVASTLTNLASNTLTGGIWRADSTGGSGATIALAPNGTSSNITTNAGDIYLVGANSVIKVGSNSIDTTLSTNDGSLRLQNGRTFNAAANSGNFTNNGLLEVTDSTFQSNTLASNGAISGFGTSTVNTGTNRITGAGSITANSGTLTITGGVNMGAGSSLTSNTGATINISGATAANNIATLLNNGSLNLGSQSINVSTDYNNANFGTGNSFSKHANVTGTGQILATGTGLSLSVSGSGITGGNTPTPTLALGNVHVGSPLGSSFNINWAGTGAPVLRGAVQTTSGLTVSAPGFGPINLGSFASESVSVTPGAAGSLSGQTLTIVTNFDNVAPQTISVTGAAFNLAAGSATPTPVTIANQRVGGSGSQLLTVSNTAPSGSFTEALDASFGANTGSATNNGGAVNLLAGQGSNAAAMSVGVNTGSAGHQSGTVTLNYVSDGSGTSGLGTTNVGSQVINVSGNVYNKAVGNTTPTPVTIANQRVGGSGSQVLTVANTAAAGSFSEALDASFSGTSGAVTTNGGSFSNLAAGSNNSSALSVWVDTTTAGAKSGSVTIAYQTDGTGSNGNSGLAAIAAGSQTVNVSGNVYNVAVGSVTPTPISFTNSHVGDTVSQVLTVANTAAAGSFSEALNASFSASSGSASGSGSVSNIAAGANNSSALSVSLNTSTAGAKSGSVTVAYQTDGTGTNGHSGLAAIAAGSQTVNVTGNVYNLAQSNVIAPVNIVAHVGDGGGSISQALTIQNMAPAGAFSEGLNSAFGSYTAGGGDTLTPTFFGVITNLAAGSTDSSSMTATISTATAGLFNGSVVVTQASNGATTSGLGITPLASQNVGISGSVTGGVFTYAQPTINTAQPLDFGNVRVGTSVGNQSISVSNTAPVASTTELLDGSFVSAPSGFTGSGSFSGLAPGAAPNTSISVGMNTGSAGHQAGNVAIKFISDGTAIAGDNTTTNLGNTNVAVQGNVYRLANPTLNSAANVTLAARVGNVAPTTAISVTNNSPDAYTENLKASVSAIPSGFSNAGGAIGGLVAGATDAATLKVGLNTGTAGTFTGNATVNYTSSVAAGEQAAADVGAGSSPIALIGKVYTQAVGAVNTALVNFGIVRVGSTPSAQNIGISNTAGITGLNDTLTATVSGLSGPFSGNGTVSGIAAQGSVNAAVSLNTATAGIYSQTALVALLSHDGDLADVSAGANANVTVQAQVNNLADAVFGKSSGAGSLSGGGTSYTLDLGNILAGSGLLSSSLFLENSASGPADGLKGTFDLTALTNPDLSASGWVNPTNLLAGQSQTGLDLSFNPTALGQFSDTITFAGVSFDANNPDYTLGTITLNIVGNVTQQSSVPEPGSLALVGIALLALVTIRRRSGMQQRV